MYRINVLHIVSRYFPSGGGSFVRINSLLNRLVEENACEVHVLTSKEANSKYYKSEDIVGDVYTHRVTNVFEMVKRAKEICVKHKINIVHGHKPSYVLLGKLLNIATVAEIHGYINYDFPKSFLVPRIYKIVDKIVVLSGSMKKEAINRLNIDINKINVVYNGVDMNIFDFKKYSRRNNNNFLIGFVGTFYKWQGIEHLLDAFAIVKNRTMNKNINPKLLLVGDGPLRQPIENKINSLNIKNYVSITGMVPFKQVPKYIASMDVFVIPRPQIIETNSALPLKLLEGMAMAKPVIATDIPGIREVIRNGFNGILVDSKNLVSSLAEAILMLLDNKSITVNFGLNAYDTVQSRFSWDISAEHLFNIYSNLLDSSRGWI